MRCHPTSEPLNSTTGFPLCSQPQTRSGFKREKSGNMSGCSNIVFRWTWLRLPLFSNISPVCRPRQSSSLYLCVLAIIRSQRPSSDTILTWETALCALLWLYMWFILLILIWNRFAYNVVEWRVQSIDDATQIDLALQAFTILCWELNHKNSLVL